MVYVDDDYVYRRHFEKPTEESTKQLAAGSVYGQILIAR